MAEPVQSTIVRADQRVTCDLVGLVRPAEAMGEHVVLSRAAGEGDGSLKVHVVDVSRGGLGLMSPVFVPRSAVLEVEVTRPAGGTVKMPCRVQRVEMRDRGPNYFVGVSVAAEHRAAIDTLMTELTKAQAGRAA